MLVLSSKKIFFKIDGVYRTIPVKSIVYAQAEGDYVTIYLLNKAKILVRQSLNKLEEKLCTDSFLRIHRSFLVNMFFIEQFDPRNNTLLLQDNPLVFPVNRSCRERLFDFIQRIN